MARAGVAPKILMDLARHSDINLTMRFYSHTVVQDRAKALEALPDFEERPDSGTRKAATGTYDATPFSAANLTRDDKQNDKPRDKETQLTGPSRIRTSDQWIMRQDSSVLEGDLQPSGQEVCDGESKGMEVLETSIKTGDEPSADSSDTEVFMPANDLNVSEGDSQNDKQNDKPDDKKNRQSADLAALIDAWARLPEAVRAGILDMAQHSRPDSDSEKR